MSCESVVAFKGVKHFGEAQFGNQLEANLKAFIDWSILKIGGWTPVEVPSSGVFGGDFSRLRPSNDPSYDAGTIWEGVRKDWVWETGVNYVNGETYNPTQVTGVIVNGTAYGTGHPTYGFHVDYPMGRIVFNNAISVNSVVQAAYCYRNVQVYIADQAPWWDELQKNSLRVDDPAFLSQNSGAWSVLPHHRVQLPAVVIETVPNGTSEGYHLGDGALERYQDVLINIIAEDRYTRNNIVDWLLDEKDHSLHMIDFNRLYAETGYPLDSRGMVRNNPKVYPDLVKTSGDGGYRWSRIFEGQCTIERSRSAEIASINPQLYIGAVRLTVSAVISDV